MSAVLPLFFEETSQALVYHLTDNANEFRPDRMAVIASGSVAVYAVANSYEARVSNIYAVWPFAQISLASFFNENCQQQAVGAWRRNFIEPLGIEPSGVGFSLLPFDF